MTLGNSKRIAFENALEKTKFNVSDYTFIIASPALMSVILKERLPYDINYINTAPYASRYFQKPATEMMSNIIDFHNDLMVVLIFISVFIFVLLGVCICKYSTFSYIDFYLENEKVSRFQHDATAEVIFTVVPASIVYSIAAPSFALLYANNDWLEKETEVTVSITGHQ